MAKGFKHGAGGNPLNFKVAAYATEEALDAAAPRGTVVGVVTADGITSWSFDVGQPEAPEEGMLWLAIGTYGSVKLSALKKNGIHYFLIHAKQYVGGKWASKAAKVYQDGKWNPVASDVMLYDAGSVNEEYTGGIGFLKGTGGGYGAPSASASNNASNITLSAHKGAVDGANGWAFAYTKNKIDLTNFTKLSVALTSVQIRANICVFRSEPQNNGSYYAADIAAKISSDKSGILSLDISELNEGFVGVFVSTADGGNNPCTVGATISKLMLLI